MALQHTLERTASLAGVGLHMGVKTTVSVGPAPVNYGIRFVRTDVEGSPEIVADIDNVVDITRGTAIGTDGVDIRSVEHIMSALAGLEIDNCRVEVDGREIPIMDGSALPFAEVIKEAGIVEQEAQREFLTIDKPVWLYQKDDTSISLFPSDHFHITLGIDYNHPALGAQHTTLFSLDDYMKEYAPARTFCFLSEIEKLREQGLIKGGSTESAVVVQDMELTKSHIDHLRELFDVKGPLEEGKNGFLNGTKLRYYNELCRHKAVDLVGDLYLLGKPLSAHVLGMRTGHAANIEFARKIRQYVKEQDKEHRRKGAGRPLTFVEIQKILPHRYPFLMIDGVTAIEPGRSIVAYKNISFSDPFFQGHFPEYPVMPGVLQVEAMAQAAGIMALRGRKRAKDNAMFFIGIDGARFRGQVHPGDCLRIEVEMLKDRRTTVKCAGKCYVGEHLVCEAEIMCIVGKKNG